MFLGKFPAQFFIRCLAIALFCVPALARTIIVADIDDTLKISHVRSMIEAVFNASRTDVVFAGMPELLQALAAQPGQEIVYLSNAPKWLMDESHRTFLSVNGFPKGQLYLRVDDSSLTFKTRVLQQLFQAEKERQRLAGETIPTRWILIGDNGERDPIVYWEQIYQPSRGNDVAFIHAIYPDNVEQQGFSTRLRPYGSAYDLALMLMKLGHLRKDQVERVKNIVHEALLRDLRDVDEPVKAFAPWSDCHPALTFDTPGLDREWQELLGVGCALGR